MGIVGINCFHKFKVGAVLVVLSSATTVLSMAILENDDDDDRKADRSRFMHVIGIASPVVVMVVE